MPHPLATLFVGLKVRFEMRDLGYDRSQIRDAVAKLEWKHVEQAAVQAKVSQEELTRLKAGADGDHPFLDWLTNFLNSPIGQALIQALIHLLLGL